MALSGYWKGQVVLQSFVGEVDLYLQQNENENTISGTFDAPTAKATGNLTGSIDNSGNITLTDAKSIDSAQFTGQLTGDLIYGLVKTKAGLPVGTLTLFFYGPGEVFQLYK
jgi:hypothetical protein